MMDAVARIVGFAQGYDAQRRAQWEVAAADTSYLDYQRRQAQELRAAAEHDRRIRVIRNQPRNPRARKHRSIYDIAN